MFRYQNLCCYLFVFFIILNTGLSNVIGPCETCVNVLRDMADGNHALLPNICGEMVFKFADTPDVYPKCNEIINSIGEDGERVKFWIEKGCNKLEMYGERELVIPCPFHVICWRLLGLDGKGFCPIPVMENPFIGEPPTPAPLPASSTTPSPTPSSSSGPQSSCRVCINVLKEMNDGTHALLPNICSELVVKSPQDPDVFPKCTEVINAIGEEAEHVRYWIQKGCKKVEVYNERELIVPCPYHIICQQLVNLDGKGFCPILPVENPFKNDSSVAAVASSAPNTSPPAAQQVSTPPATQQAQTS